MDRNLQLVQRLQKHLQAVGQRHRARGIGQEKGAHDQERDAQDHLGRARDSFPGNDPALADRGPLGVKEIQQRRQHDDKEHRLQALENIPETDVRDGHTDQCDRNHQEIRTPALCVEERNDIQNNQDQLGSGIQPVYHRIAREILSECDVLQHPATSPVCRSARRSCSWVKTGPSS